MNGDIDIDQLIIRLIREAKYRKRRVRLRQQDLMANGLHIARRGPNTEFGRPCPRWAFYIRAVNNHRAASRNVAIVLSTIPKD